jgi:16S rRNA pseudouridine516 synthase
MSQLAKYLAHLGYGSRREVMHLLATRRVTDSRGEAVDPDAVVAHDDLRVDGEALDPPPGSVIMLHKPVGYVCSTTDPRHPVIYDLLPPRFRSRSPIMASVGRLDVDTSGLLLVTDDGPLNHRFTTPRAHLQKVYVATLDEPLRADAVEHFASGAMLLKSDPEPLAPAILEPIGERVARVTLEEGRYHQVRRMFAAVGNHVVDLERIAIGSLTLDVRPGQWRVLAADELALLSPPK